MKDMLTYRHPRTVQEAFGPYTDNSFYEPVQPYALHDKIILVILIAVLVLVPLGAYFDWL